jgi:hypothetical protein
LQGGRGPGDNHRLIPVDGDFIRLLRRLRRQETRESYSQQKWPDAIESMDQVALHNR